MIQILPRKDYRFDPEKMMMFYKTLISSNKKKRSFFQKLFSIADHEWIIDCDDTGMISIYISADQNEEALLHSVQLLLESQGDAFISNVSLEKHDTIDTLYIDDPSKHLAGYKNETVFLNILGLLQKYSRITIRFSIRGVKQEEGKSFFRSSADVEIEAQIFVSAKTKYMRNIAKELSEKICSLTADVGCLRIAYGKKYIPFTISGMELMNLMQIPSLYKKDETLCARIHHLMKGQITLNDDEYAKGIYTGKLYHPVQIDRSVYCDEDQMRIHGIVSGTTGSGKSAGIEEWIRDIIKRMVMGEKNVPGFTLLDPLESTALGVIDYILKLQADGHDVEPLLQKVRYIDFSCEESIFPIALLNRDLDVTTILDFFKSLFGDLKAIQVDRMMTSALQVLISDPIEEHTINDLRKIFDPNDDSFRKKMIERLQNDLYASDQIDFLKNTKFTQSIADPILNRLDPFINTNQKKLMFGMNSKYDMIKDLQKFMDEGCIVLMNLKGMSQFELKVVIGYLTTQYYLKAKGRADFSRLHLLFVEEAHEIQMPIFPKICAELRKSGLSLFLITQFLEQFDPDYLKQLIGNINTLLSFKQKESGAAVLSRMIPSQDVSKQDLMQLQSRVGYLSTQEGGKERSILIRVDPPYRYTDGALVDYQDPAAVVKNQNKNREYARSLFARDFISKRDAEEIVFRTHYRKKEELRELMKFESELLQEGDALLPVENESIVYELSEEEKTIWD